MKRAKLQGWLIVVIAMILIAVGVSATSRHDGLLARNSQTLAEAHMAYPGPDHQLYAPLIIHKDAPTITITPTVTPTTTPSATPQPACITIADFDACDQYNNLGGEMGTAWVSPSWADRRFLLEDGRGCVAAIQCIVDPWIAFYMKTNDVDLSTCSTLCFDIRFNEGYYIPTRLKVEIKRDDGSEWSYARVDIPDTSNSWQEMTIDILPEDLTTVGGYQPVSSLDDIEEIVITFEHPWSGPLGTSLYWFLDNVRACP